ncbi:SRPBCC family protein [Bradyrhizobium sp. CCBAU 11357]|uniref:SRPBCC family protein n=1 Tax=Bradyrhizobium sp. CCBAU 11357 TaxID=1630808 RepID=UPI0023021BD9|nr:SRPBCC family protein [Bradyrhizobium sp. CCBAU 11357]MDA9501596.1 ATPase [Bradyrhizobium sp. CCBAU 11357]
MSKPKFVYVTYIETTPEKLWQALTSSEFTRQYWFGAEVRSDWKLGSPFALLLDGEVTDSGEILESDRPRRLSYSFKHHKFEELRDEPASRVVFTLEPFGPLVRLTVLHDGFVEGGKYLGAISNGWPAILSGLKSLLERGQVLAIPRTALNKGFDAK